MLIIMRFGSKCMLEPKSGDLLELYKVRSVQRPTLWHECHVFRNYLQVLTTVEYDLRRRVVVLNCSDLHQ